MSSFISVNTMLYSSPHSQSLLHAPDGVSWRRLDLDGLHAPLERPADPDHLLPVVVRDPHLEGPEVAAEHPRAAVAVLLRLVHVLE